MQRKGRSGSTSTATWCLKRIAPMLQVQWAEEEVAEEVPRCLEEMPRKVASLQTEEMPRNLASLPL